jgi:hypothetical protein
MFVRSFENHFPDILIENAIDTLTHILCKNFYLTFIFCNLEELVAQSYKTWFACNLSQFLLG